MHAVVGASEEGGAAIILHRVLLTIEVSHEGDGVVNARGEREELLIEVTSRALVVEVSNSADQLAKRSLVTAKIVGQIFSIEALCNVELCANTVLLPVSTSSSLEFGNFIPNSRVSVSREIRGWGRELALAGRGYFH